MSQQIYEFELDFAARVCSEAGLFLQESTSQDSKTAVADAQQALDFQLSHEPCVSFGSRWISHVDEHIVSIALVDDEHGPVVGAVCRPSTDELLCAALDGGSFMGTVADGPHGTAPALGMASTSCNVVHVPFAKVPEIEMALESLNEKFPMDVTRVPCCCCCEGLFEVMSGRADVHVSPPDHCYVEQTTPVPVLCAFEVLLTESGGVMTDVLGSRIDFARAMMTGDHSGGVLASESNQHNYMVRSVRSSFTSGRMVLPRLADTLRARRSAQKGSRIGDISVEYAYESRDESTWYDDDDEEEGEASDETSSAADEQQQEGADGSDGLGDRERTAIVELLERAFKI